MNEIDGWDHIHHAAFRGFVKSVERFIKTDPDTIEKETEDDLRSTPLLLAAMSGSKDMVECLIGLGARINATNSQNQGVVELCAFKEYVQLLEYLHNLQNEKLPVWKLLVKFMLSDQDEEAEAGAKCLCSMTTGMKSENGEEMINPNVTIAMNNGCVPAIIKMLKGTIGEQAKYQIMRFVLNLCVLPEVQEQAVSGGIIPPIVKHLRASSNDLIGLSAKVLRCFCTKKEFSDLAVQNSAFQGLIKVLQVNRDANVLIETCHTIGAICCANPLHREVLSGIVGAIKTIVALYDECSDKSVQLALTLAIGDIVRGNSVNQQSFVDEGICVKLLPLIKIESHKYNYLKMAAVEAIYRLAEENSSTQKAFVDNDTVNPLLGLLKRSRQTETQEKIAEALWALAGQNADGQSYMAEALGVQQLTEFLNTSSERLIYIGSEGISVLAKGPEGRHEEIFKNNGVSAIVRLLRWDKEYIVISGIRTLRSLAVKTGYIPHPGSQNTISQNRGVKYLVALMVHSRNEEIQVEAAHTLGCVSLDNKDILDEIYQNLDFNFIRVMKMLYSQQRAVRLTAGSALAAFAYNNVKTQKQISDLGGVLFSFFEPFITSGDEYEQCYAAFQVVVLARIVPDQEQALSSAAGVKLLVDLLHKTSSDIIKALACDCVARLVHTRAGIPAAFVSIDCVEHLADLLSSESRLVQGNAAIAIGFLSFDHEARRRILKKCRLKPPLMKVIKTYTAKTKLSEELLEGWKHFQQVGLPAAEHFASFLPKDHPSPFNVQGDDSTSRPRTSSTAANDGELTSRHSQRTSQSLSSLPGEGSFDDVGAHSNPDGIHGRDSHSKDSVNGDGMSKSEMPVAVVAIE